MCVCVFDSSVRYACECVRASVCKGVCICACFPFVHGCDVGVSLVYMCGNVSLCEYASV